MRPGSGGPTQEDFLFVTDSPERAAEFELATQAARADVKKVRRLLDQPGGPLIISHPKDAAAFRRMLGITGRLSNVNPTIRPKSKKRRRK